MQVNENSLKTIMSGTKTRLPRQPKTVTNAKSRHCNDATDPPRRPPHAPSSGSEEQPKSECENPVGIHSKVVCTPVGGSRTRAQATPRGSLGTNEVAP